MSYLQVCKPNLTIVIVNWNSGVQLAEVVASLSMYHTGLVSTVIIIDNASYDDSLGHVDLLKNLSFQVQIVRNKENYGFGAACNQGAALASSEFLLFLNPDTLLYADSLSVPVNFMQDPAHKNVAVVGIQLLDEHNHIARSCARFPSLTIFFMQAIGLNRLPGLRHFNVHLTDWAHDESRSVDHVIGAFYLIRRNIFNSLGGFDERFFVYLEDLDLSLRVHKAGYRSVYVSDAQAFHLGGGTSRQVKAHRLFYSLRSRLLYGFKHFSKIQAWSLLILTLGLECVARLVFSLADVRFGGLKNTLLAYVMLWRALPSILLRSRR
jgi:GT2 family glycosyltransferase